MISVLSKRGRNSQLVAAHNARALSSSAAVEASVLEIEEAESSRHNFTQTDSATTENFSEGGHRMPPPAHSRRLPMIYTAREAAENEVQYSCRYSGQR